MTDQTIPMCKIVMIGDSSVGKTSALVRFCDKRFSENSMPTLGVDYKIKTEEIDGRPVKLMLWDTSGQEKYNAISKSFFGSANGVMIFFSVTDKDSFDHVHKWIEKTYTHLPKDVTLMLVGRPI